MVVLFPFTREGFGSCRSNAAGNVVLIENRGAPARCVDMNTEDVLPRILLHVVVIRERHLRHPLRSFATSYNQARTHPSVNKDAQSPHTIHAVGCIVQTSAPIRPNLISNGSGLEASSSYVAPAI
jgi:hypothetical protein